MHILLTGHEQTLTQRLAVLLTKSSFTVDVVDNVEDCLSYVKCSAYALIILDTGLTPANNMELLKTLRQKKIPSPILVISDRRDVADRVNGLDSGADDYLCKPFAPDEFLARIRALLRRKDKVYEFSLLSFGDIFLNLKTNELLCNDHIVRLGLKEFQIMKMLINSGRQILSKEQLIEKVWGINLSSEYNNIEVYISFLRKKIAKLDSNVSIKTLRGIGYFLN